MDARILLQFELEDLLARYGTALDDGPLSTWPTFFHEECRYEIVPRDNHDLGLPLAIMRCESRGMLEDRVRAVKETMVYEPRYLRHHITNARVVENNGATILATANYSVVEVLHDELPRILSVGRYLDTLERDAEGKLLFRAKRVVYDSVLVPNTIVYPL